MFDAAPEEWREVVLSDVAEIVTAGISADELATKPEVHHYSLPAFDLGLGPEIGPGEAIKSNKTVVPRDCILFSKLNPRIPRIWRVRETASPDSYCSTEFWPLVRKSDDIDLDFLTFLLGSTAFLGNPTIVPSSSTNSHQRVDRRSFESFVLPLPALDEQRRIADVLVSMDEAIRTSADVARTARNTFNRLIDALHDENADNTAPLSSFCVPKGLQTGPFGSQLKVSDYVDVGVPVLMPTDLRPDGIDFLGAKATSFEKFAQLKQHALQPGDILFSRRGDVEKCGVYLEDDPVAMCGTGCLRARIDRTRADPILIYFLVQSERCGAWLSQHAVGVTMPNLNTAIIGALPVPNLPMAEQERWVEALLMAEGVSRANERHLIELARVKDAVAGDLLSGRVRVPA